MSALVGLDVGTTGVKAIAITPEGEVVARRRRAIRSRRRTPAGRSRTLTTGSAEARKRSLASASTCSESASRARCTVWSVWTRRDRVLRPAILWNDQRTGAECAEIEELVGLERLISLTGNRALPGFTAPKLLWLRRHEPDLYARIRRIVLPKDYVRLRLTGEWAIDAADASGTLLFDVAHRSWSDDVLAALDIPREWLPPVHESTEIAGAGDQQAAALGVGVVEPGTVSVVLGTSGVVLAALPRYAHDTEARVHAFCHAVPDTWEAMGVMLNAAGSLRWLRDLVAPGTPFDDARIRGGSLGCRGGGLDVPPVPAGRADPARGPGSSRLVHGPLRFVTIVALSSARCSRASPTACATRSTSCASSGSLPSRAACRAVERAAGCGWRSSLPFSDFPLERHRRRGRLCVRRSAARGDCGRGLHGRASGHRVVRSSRRDCRAKP